MNCPKCGTQNPDDAQLCTSCNYPLTQPPQPAETVKVKISRLAITALAIALLSIFAFVLTVTQRSNIFGIIYIFAVMLAFTFGIISLIQIGLSAGRIAGLGFTITAVIIAIAPSLFIFVNSIFYRPRSVAFKMTCGSNLSGIGRAMLIYANDYDNDFPRAGYAGTKWGNRIHDWAAPDRATAFGLERGHTGGSATISSSLYALIKYAEVTPKSFCCKDDIKTKPFKASDYISNMADEDAWDFGPEPTKHYSYSYHMPYGPYFLSTDSSEPGMAVAADRNPWLDPFVDTTRFRWDDQTKTGGRENIKGYQKGNCGHHQREGQNVLFMDNHVYFEKQSFCGVNEDNIYTYWNGSDIRQGAPPVFGSQPADRLDSLLVNEQPKKDQK